MIYHILFLLLIHKSLCQTCNNGQTPPYCDECGKSFSTPNVRIVGGSEAVPYSWPSMALVEFNYKFIYRSVERSFSARCAGSIINRDSILTAAHCFVTTINLSDGTKIKVEPNNFYPSYQSMYDVYIGIHRISEALESNRYKIAVFTIHPDYSGNFINDVGIIRLAREITYDQKIQPACLPYLKPKVYPTQSNINSWAAGWGRLSSGGQTSDSLRNVKLIVYSCSSNSNYVICSGDIAGGKDTCQGDSGGPLFVKDTVNGAEKYIEAGITSFGDGCGEPNQLGGYTRVSWYLDWITETITKDKSLLTNGNNNPGNSNNSIRIRYFLYIHLFSLLLAFLNFKF